MSYGALADSVLILHLCYVGFVVIAQLLIILGACFRWKWVRNPWFRCIHLLMISIVVVEAALGITCPLSTWEYHYRNLAEQPTDILRQGEWIPQIPYPLFVMRKCLFPGCGAGVYLPIYVTFTLLVVIFFFLAPPRWKRPLLHH
jgi:hypothetical protein